MSTEMTPTADPKKIVDTLRQRLKDTPSNELNDYVRRCLRVARKQGRKEGLERRGITVCNDPNHEVKYLA